jgi:hypothetical protein
VEEEMEKEERAWKPRRIRRKRNERKSASDGIKNINFYQLHSLENHHLKNGPLSDLGP